MKSNTKNIFYRFLLALFGIIIIVFFIRDYMKRKSDTPKPPPQPHHQCSGFKSQDSCEKQDKSPTWCHWDKINGRCDSGHAPYKCCSRSNKPSDKTTCNAIKESKKCENNNLCSWQKEACAYNNKYHCCKNKDGGDCINKSGKQYNCQPPCEWKVNVDSCPTPK
jgi:hypothetical protein